MNEKKEILEELYEADPSLKLNDTKVEQSLDFLLKNNPKVHINPAFRTKLHQKLNTIWEFKQIEGSPKTNYLKYVLPAFLTLILLLSWVQLYNYTQTPIIAEPEESYIVADSRDQEADAQDSQDQETFQDWETLIEEDMIDGDIGLDEEEWNIEQNTDSVSNSSRNITNNSPSNTVNSSNNTSSNNQAKVVENAQEIQKQNENSNSNKQNQVKPEVEEEEAIQEDEDTTQEEQEDESLWNDIVQQIFWLRETKPRAQSETSQESNASASSSARSQSRSTASGSIAQSASWSVSASGSTNSWKLTGTGTQSGTWELRELDVYKRCEWRELIVNSDDEEKFFIKQYCDDRNGRIFDNEKRDVYMCRIEGSMIAIDYIEKELCQ